MVIGDGGCVLIAGACTGELWKSGNGNAVGEVGVISIKFKSGYLSCWTSKKCGDETITSVLFCRFLRLVFKDSTLRSNALAPSRSLSDPVLLNLVPVSSSSSLSLGNCI